MLPPEVPRDTDPMVLLRQALKVIGRRFGWGVKEAFPAGERPGPAAVGAEREGADDGG
jgi:hypothetical protein